MLTKNQIKNMNSEKSSKLREQIDFLCQQKNYQQAHETLDEVLKKYNIIADVWHLKGHVYEQQNNFANALKCHELATNYNPNHHNYWLSKCIVLGILQRYELALAAIEKAIKIDNDLKLLQARKAYINSIILEKSKNYKLALAAINETLKLDSGLELFWAEKIRIIRLYLPTVKVNEKIEKLFAEILDAYTFVIFRASNNENKANYYYGKSGILWRCKRFDEAHTAIDEAITINAQKADFWYQKGRIFFAQENYIEAYKCLDKAFKITPTPDQTSYIDLMQKIFEAVNEAIKCNPRAAILW